MIKKPFQINIFVLIFSAVIFLLTPLNFLWAQKEIIAYFPSWKVKQNPYYVKNIVEAGSADKLTVLNYAFVVPGPDSLGNIVPQFMHPYYDYVQVYRSDMSVDGVADDSINQALRGHFNQLKKLKKDYPRLKIVLSIGGWGGSTYFSDAALTERSREVFVNACIDIFIKGNLPIQNNTRGFDSGQAGGKGTAEGIFDGFDVDWEFPYRGGPDGIHHNKNDITNFTKLLKLFREKLDSIKPGFLLTSAVPAREADMKYFNFYEDQQYLDWYNLMTYDYHGSWDSLTNHHTNLLTSPKDIISKTNSESFDKSIKLFNEVYGVSKNKIVPGAAFYGRAWAKVDSFNNGLYQTGKADSVIFGFNNYSDFEIILSGTFFPDKQKYNYYWDNYAMAPYLYNSKQKNFWTFDDVKSIALKSRYVDAYNLRGIMFWEISGDDSEGTLVNTIYKRNMPDIKIDKIKNENNLININILNPKESDWINEGSNVIITAQSTGEIIKAEFFGDEKSLGYTTYKPFSWVWFNVPEGNHKIKVLAIDVYGNKIFSDPVKIYIHTK